MKTTLDINDRQLARAKALAAQPQTIGEHMRRGAAQTEKFLRARSRAARPALPVRPARSTPIKQGSPT